MIVVAGDGVGAGSRSGHPVDANRLGNVLQILGAEIVEPELDPAANLADDNLRHDDRPRFGQGFQPGRHINTLAEKIAVFDHDIAKVDPDANEDPSIFGDYPVGPASCRLICHGAFDRIDGADEFHQNPIPHRLDKAPAMFGQKRRQDCVVPDGERMQGAGFIPAHQAAVADHVGNQDRGESTQTGACHAILSL